MRFVDLLRNQSPDKCQTDWAVLVDAWLIRVVLGTKALRVGALASKAEGMMGQAAGTVQMVAACHFGQGLVAVVTPAYVF